MKDFWNVIASNKLGIPGWQWFRAQALGDPSKPGQRDVLLTGGVPKRMYTKGPRKGQPDWRGVMESRVVLTPAEMADALMEARCETLPARRGDRREAK